MSKMPSVSFEILGEHILQNIYAIKGDAVNGADRAVNDINIAIELHQPIRRHAIESYCMLYNASGNSKAVLNPLSRQVLLTC